MLHYHADVRATWAQLVSGWASHLAAAGANLLIDGIRNHAEPRGSYEGVTRMLWGFGGWLHLNPAPSHPEMYFYEGGQQD